MSQYKSLLKKEIARCPTRLSTNKKRINVRRSLWENFKAARISKIGHIVPIHVLSGPWCNTRVPYCTKISGGIWRLVLSTNFSSNHSCCCVLFSAIAITHISSCCRRAAIRWGRTLVTLEFGADEVKPPETKKDQEQLVYRQIIIIASSNLPQWLMCFVGLSGKVETTC